MSEEPIEGEVVDEAPAKEKLPVPVSAQPLPVLAKDDPIAGPVVKHLLRKTPASMIQKRRGPGGITLSYVPWAYAARRLVETFGTYSFEIVGEPRNIELPDLPAKPARGSRAGTPARRRTEVMVTMRLSIGRRDDPITIIESVGSSIYYPDNPDGSFGDSIQAAQSYALRRAAARLGIALDLYANTDESPVDTAAEDAKTAWRSALSQQGFTEQAAVTILSERMTSDATALPTIRDCLDATGEEGPAAYWVLIKRLTNGE